MQRNKLIIRIPLCAIYYICGKSLIFDEHRFTRTEASLKLRHALKFYVKMGTWATVLPKLENYLYPCANAFDTVLKTNHDWAGYL